MSQMCFWSSRGAFSKAGCKEPLTRWPDAESLRFWPLLGRCISGAEDFCVRSSTVSLRLLRRLFPLWQNHGVHYDSLTWK